MLMTGFYTSELFSIGNVMVSTAIRKTMQPSCSYQDFVFESKQEFLHAMMESTEKL